mgnify:CR=1 FL=1
MLKKTIRRLGALAMVLAMAVSVFAVSASAASEETTPAPNITKMQKELQVFNGTISETFNFVATYTGKSEDTTCDAPYMMAGSEKNTITAGNTTFITINSAAFTNATTTSTVDAAISLNGDFEGPGTYYFDVAETAGTTAGMTYDNVTKKLVVQHYSDGSTKYFLVNKISDEAKDDGVFHNKYEASTLTIHKDVTGLQGDKGKDFTAKVKFTAPAGKTVNSTITYGNQTIAPTAWVNDEVTVEITLHDGTDNDVIFTNVPYGVTYTVTEDSYTNVGYTTTYTNQSGTISEAATNVTVENKKDGTTPGGVIMTIAPYALMVVLAGAFAVVFLTRRNRAE